MHSGSEPHLVGVEVDVVRKIAVGGCELDLNLDVSELGLDEADLDGNVEQCIVTPSKQVGAEEDDDCDAPAPPPEVGMVFETCEQVEEFYSRYARRCGFGIVRLSSAFKKGTKIKRCSKWTCEHYGKYRQHRVGTKKDDPAHVKVNGSLMKHNLPTDSAPAQDEFCGDRKSKKVDCGAHLYASLNVEGKWEIQKLVLEHTNHNPSPSKTRFIPMYRKECMTSHVKRRLEMGRSVGLGVSKVHDVIAAEHNGLDSMMPTERDLRNEDAKEKRLKLSEGDANAMLKYFAKMTADNQNFFHMHRVDDEGYLKDIVWVDARSRAAYKEFSDVVCFDATYLTNQYDMPFANFVGVNHHGQSILLGCALIGNETASTYEWVFRTWLNCMEGVAPLGILTDQAPAMRKALKAAMPNTRHRWCIWHITSKFWEKLGRCSRYQEFKEELMNVIYDSLVPEEFEENWQAVVSEYGLIENKWLAGLYEEREMWVPAYTKHMFWAGMKTTQRVESINSFFDDYVDRHTKLYEFAERYCKAMEVRAEQEAQADANCARYTRLTRTHLPFEKVFQQAYTDMKFRDVQIECSRVLYLKCRDLGNNDDGLAEYKVIDRVWVKPKANKKEIFTLKPREFKVCIDLSTNHATCDCSHFECYGIVCKHIFKIWWENDVFEVPEKYILRRWRKDVARVHTRVKVAYHDPSKNEVVCRFDKLMLLSEPVFSRAALYQSTMKKACESLELLSIHTEERIKEIEKGESENPSSANKSNNKTNSPHQGSTNGLGVKDPPLPPKKVGRKRTKRLMSNVEKAVTAAKNCKSKKGKGKATPGNVSVEDICEADLFVTPGLGVEDDLIDDEIGPLSTTAFDDTIEMFDLEGSLAKYSDHAHRVRLQRDMYGKEGMASTNASHVSLCFDLNL